MKNQKGTLVVSLDFELFWGIAGVVPIGRYRQNLHGARVAIPRILELFAEYDIRCTWATVGMLFYDSKRDLIGALPAERPRYRNPELSAYAHLPGIGDSEATDPLHYAGSLVDLIATRPGQELGSHTFSHYYCNEPGQTEVEFVADLRAALTAAKRTGRQIRSIVFPRNQVNPAYLKQCRAHGLTAYRGNLPHYLFQPTLPSDSAYFRRALRLLDSYICLSGQNCFAWPSPDALGLYDIPGSRFLRPHSPRFWFLEPLRVSRITTSLTHAAKNRLNYHLWWHPHDFGNHLEMNLAILRRILEHFRRLREEYGMRSLNMGDMVAEAGSGENGAPTRS
ncbi:MAG TPA: polysaccharide deacetylase family protein [Lacunisphaera sp.]|nr:polysaccharide deacetylase family protein [Lacunisphaera sp.]